MKSAASIFFVLFLLVAPLCHSQSIEQLRQEVKKNEKTTRQVDALLKLADMLVGQDPNDARKQAEQAEKLARQLKYQEGLVGSLALLGHIYAFHQGKHDRAVAYYQEAYQLKKQQFQNGQITAQVFKNFLLDEINPAVQMIEMQPDASKRDKKSLKEYKLIQGEYANWLAEVAMAREREIKRKELLIDSAATQLENREKELGKVAQDLSKQKSQSMRLSRANRALSDSLQITSDYLEIATDSLETTTNMLLLKELELQEQTIQRMAEEAKTQQLQQEKEVQQLLIYATSGGLTLFTALMGVLFVSYRKRVKMSRVLEAQRNELAEKNEEIQLQNENILVQKNEIEIQKDKLSQKNSQITASITYAERIQKAILPDPDAVSVLLPDSFIFFQPRDIVSGDFYWISAKRDEVIIAAMDCTGHGVPGAFMSMIGHTLLNELINQRGITAPDEILNRLHIGIRHALKQKQTGNQDGMDAAICTVDFGNRTVSFAGAKNPMLLIQGDEMQVVKGDKMPIGGKQTEEQRIFTRHTFPLVPQTYIYLFSDGFQDQFGGPDGRKFMLKNLQHLIWEHHTLPMEMQHQTLKNAFNQWLGHERQIDDVLMIGTRLA